MDPEEPIQFSPEDMASFERAAVKPYLQASQFTDNAGQNYGSKTRLRQHVRVSADKNLQLHLFIMEWRNGTTGIKATLWTCYEGEGEYTDGNAYALDEAYDVGIALFPAPGVTEDNMFNVWKYTHESEAILNSTDDFPTKYNKIVALFNSQIASAAPRDVPPAQNETAVRIVGAMLGEDDDELMREMATVAAGGASRLALAMQRNEEYSDTIPAEQNDTFSLELKNHKVEWSKTLKHVSVCWTHRRDSLSQYSWKRGGGFTFYVVKDANDLERFVSLFNGVIEAAKRICYDDSLMVKAYQELLTMSKPGSNSKYGDRAWYFSSGQDMEFLKFGKRRRLGRRR